jgi:hypothetical protein
MRIHILVVLLCVFGAVSIAASYLWNHYMSEGEWSRPGSETPMAAPGTLHSELTAMERATSRSKTGQVDLAIQRRFDLARQEHARARDEFRRARKMRTIGTYVLRTGGCVLLLAGTLTFLFHRSRIAH